MWPPTLAPTSSLRVRAYQTLAAISPKAGGKLFDAIRRSDNPVLGVRLLQVLASLDGAGEYLKHLRGRAEILDPLVDFELARAAGDDKAAALSAAAAVKRRHPTVVDCVLDRARGDVGPTRPGSPGSDTSRKDAYTPALLACIDSLKADSGRLRAEHLRAEAAARLLADIGTPRATAGLKRLLQGKADARKRRVAAGLVRTGNKAACFLLRPLLASPQDELATYAASALGRFGDAAAKPRLSKSIANQRRRRITLVAIACWYVLKIEGRAAAAVRQLAGGLK
jgi:hypothetical protein